MSKVTIIDGKTARVIDSENRVLTVKKLSSVYMMKLYGALGPEKSLVDRYVGFAALAASVVKIGEIVMAFPRSATEVESIVGQLDEHGLEAVAEALKALAPPEKPREVAEAAENL